MRPRALLALTLLVAACNVAYAQSPKAPISDVVYPTSVVGDRVPQVTGVIAPTPKAVARANWTAHPKDVAQIRVPTTQIVAVLPHTGVGGLAGAAVQTRQFDRDDARFVEANAARVSELASGPIGVMDVVQLTRQGVNEYMIAHYIRQSNSTYRFSPANLALLKENKVSEMVINEIASRFTQEANGLVGVLDVLELTKQGTGDEVVLSYIRQSKSTFRLSTEDLALLKENKVSDQVINEMLLSYPFRESNQYSYQPPAREVVSSNGARFTYVIRYPSSRGR